MVWLILGAILLVALIGILLFLYLFSQGQNRFVQITGTGVVKRQPNEASVTIGLHTDNIPDTEIAPALEFNGAKFARIVDAIRRVFSRADIETRTYSLSPSNAMRPDNNYTIYNSAVVQVHGADELIQLPQLIRTAVQNGSNSVSNVQYSLSEGQLETARIDSEKLALENAFEKAKQLANLINARLGKTYQIIDHPLTQQSRSFSVTSNTLQDNILFVPRDIDVSTQITIKQQIN